MRSRLTSLLILLIITAAAGAGTLRAQQPDTAAVADSLRPGGSIEVLARASTDSVILRWAPDNPATWVKTRQTGFVIERAEVDTLTEFDSTAVETISEQPVMPWDLQTFEQRVPEDDEFAMLAAEALYGERFVIEPMEGDNPIEALRNASDELTNRFGFALLAADNSTMAAEGLGLRYVDRNVEEGATYIYTVSPAEFDTTFPVQSGTAVVDIEEHTAPPPPRDLTANPGDNSIMLSWKELPGEAYSGYYIYRSSDAGQTYRQLNEEPHFFLTGEQPNGESIVQFADTSAVNYQRYHYRVRGVTPFSELSRPAEVAAMARDMTPPPVPAIRMPEEVSPGAIEVTWSYPDTVRDLEGFYVTKSNYQTFESSESLIEDPLPPSARSYTDTTATTDRPWYFVVAVDTAGNAIPSFGAYGELIDRIPPSRPTGLQGTIDTTGTVHLTWDLGPEEDIIGYRLLYANNPTHEFSPVTSMIVRDTSYTDTIAVKTLTKSIYYKIAAYDERYNQSEFSEVLKLERPDIVPPDPPVFSGVTPSDSAVALAWHPSSSRDLERMVLYRRESGTGVEWDSLAGFSRSAAAYLDTAVVQNRTYRYRIQAVDSAGLRSVFASTVQARPYDTGMREAPVLATARYDSADGRVVLEWRYREADGDGEGGSNGDSHYFVIYRSTAGNPPVTFKAVEGDRRRFEDPSVIEGYSYSYAVKVRMRSGAQSRLSRIVSVAVGRPGEE
ncbi:MAG: hypothetical protein R3224_08135 [Balneolaceae bacterium]|nr:hypothetical protein [Balneolaceae bacterium]